MNILRTSRPSTRRNALIFLLTASFAAVAFRVILVATGVHKPVWEGPAFKDWIPYAPPPKTTTSLFENCASGLPSGHRADLDRSRQTVATTKGYYARDYTLGLGWNNVRYIIESALLHAYTLNRTLILPSFVYARACEWDIKVCAAFVPMVNRGDAVGQDEWRNLPMNQQMGWRIPIENMIDLPHLRKTFPVVLVSEYLQLHGLDPALESSNGDWDESVYHKGTNPTTLVSVIPNEDYEPSAVTRVDDLKPFSHMKPRKGKVDVHQDLMRALGVKSALDWEDARRSSIALWEAGSDEEVTELLEENGWATLYTYEAVNTMDMLKAVIMPTRQVAPYSRLKGLADDYGEVKEDVLVLKGEVHSGRKPGSLRFTTQAARDKFTHTVLYTIRPPEGARNLAAVLHDRMTKRVGGRMWMAAHMRRGDFLRLGWAVDDKIENHLWKVKDRFNGGRATLNTIHTSKELRKYDVPNATTDMDQVRLEPPRHDDPFYIATDERSADDLKYLRENGAVLISDLLESDDRRTFGWGIMLTDIMSIVEQELLARASFFYAHAVSSVAGGVLNLRAARGVDPRTTLVD